MSPTRERTRRGTELVLLVFSVAIAMAAYAAVGLAVDGVLPTGMLGYGGGLALLFGIAHVTLRRFAPYADPVLLPAVTVINGLGLAVIHRLDLAYADRAERLGRDIPSAAAPAQLTWTAVGVALFVVVLLLVRDHRILQRFTYTAMVAGLGLLLLPLLPLIGTTINGARIWIRVFGFSFQPGELAKLVLLVFFAGYLVVKRDVLALAGRRVLGVDLPRARDLGPVLVAWVASLGVLVFERDLGTSLLFFGVFIALLYVATERLSWLLIGVALFLSGAYVAWTLFGHVRERVDIWLHAFAPRNIDDDSYQLVQGLFGMGTGGLLGKGLGRGRPEIVPYAQTDFIVAAIGEELGLTGLMALLVVYAIAVQRGLRTSIAVRDSFGKLLAAGLAFSVALQVFVVVGGVTRLIPLTGLTLPFLSYGGSSLVANYALVALLLRISNAARAPAPRRPAPPPAPLADSKTVVVERPT
ncbi:MAG: FtsW/RodA/SpoVE family cell cycle protein [Pseudonocardiales bacterium]|nr:FtsW/RodA/SpoVE family cell cycle protein [Pseudonocardiales bacterium]